MRLISLFRDFTLILFCHRTCYLCSQGVLIGNHLPTQDLQDIVLYCRFHCLFTTSDQQRLAHLVIWREVGHLFVAACNHSDGEFFSEWELCSTIPHTCDYIKAITRRVT